jgi:hypothetical protein
MCFYLYPLFRNRRALAAASERTRTSDAEQPDSPGMQIDEDKSSLLSWLHVRSRDRFSTHDSPNAKQSSKFESPILTLPRLNRQPSSFARGSLIPHLSPATLTPPPPAYASQPSSPLALGDFRFPPSFSADSNRSPRSPRPSPVLPVSVVRRTPPSHNQHVEFDASHMPTRPRSATPQSRSRSGTGPSSTLAVRPLMAPRRTVSANTLHPADLHTPSHARVYAAGESDMTARPVARTRETAGLGLGIGLAARGRVLTRGPSSSWNQQVGAKGVGSPF